MAGPLRLAIEITGSAGGLKPAAAGARAEIQGIGGAAETASKSASAMGASFEVAGRTIDAATSTAAERVRGLQATLERASAVRFDALGMAIAPRVAEIATATGDLSRALVELRARFDPATAAALRYESALADLREAHRLGAVSGEQLVRREAELKAAYERTTAAIANRAAAEKAAVERTVAAQTITPDRGADVAAYGAELDQLRAKYNPVWAAGQQYRQEVEAISRAERVGAISAAEAAAARERVRTATGTQVAALRAATSAEAFHAGAMKLSAFQAQNLSYQLHDVVVSLASGMNPLTVALQQGSQITPIFGGIGGTLSAVTSVLTPFRIGLGLAATAIGLAAKVTLDHSAAMKEAEVAAAGLGRNVGTSAGEIDRISRSSADSGQVSVSAARSMATEFTRTGKIGKENFGGLIGVVKNFALATGTDASAATKTLADLMADPAKGAETLSQSMGLIDASTARFVRRLADQGQTTEAVAVLTKTLGANLTEVGKTVSWYAQMWGLVERAASGAADAIGRAVAPKVGQDLIRDLEARVEALKQQSAQAPGLQGNTPSAPGYGMWADKGPTAPDGEKARQAEIQRLEGEIAKMKKEEADAEARRQAAIVDAARSRAVDIAGSSGSPAVQEALRRQQLQDDQKKLREAGTGPTKMSDADQQAEKDRLKASEDTRIAAALDAKTHALTTWISESDRARQLAEIDLAIQATRDPVERAALERRRALVTIAGQEVTTAEADAAAQTAYARALGEVSATAKGNLADMAADVAARTRINALVAVGALSLSGVNRELQIEQATRQLVAAAARAEGAEKERLLALAEETARAITAQDAAQRRASAQKDLRSGADRLETLRTEIALVGRSEAARARVLSLLEAEQKIRSQGWGGVEAEEIRTQALASADLTTSLERQKAAWQEIGSTGGDAIDTIVEGLRQGKIDGTALVEDLQKELFKLALANPLKNWAFGQNLPTLSDAGGLLGNLFGGSAATAPISGLPKLSSMQVTAATVVVNGSLSSALGIGGLLSNGGVDRSGFASQLTPAVRAKLFAMTEAEVGGQGGLAQQGFMETIFNRSAARGKSLDETLSDRGYFPAVTFDRAGRVMGSGSLDAKYGSIFESVRGGSNITNLATGNASGGVGFGGGPLTAMFGGESFGREKADMGWASALERSSRDASQSIAGLGASTNSTASAFAELRDGTSAATDALARSGDDLARSATGIGTSASGLETASKQTATAADGAFGQLFGVLGKGIDGLVSGLGSLLAGIGSLAGGGGGGIFSWLGGLFGAKAGGGLITGPGTGTSDSILGAYPVGTYIVNAAATASHRALLESLSSGAANDTLPTWVSAGEFAVDPATARRHLPLLEAINRGALPRRAAGGTVDARSIGRMPIAVSGGRTATGGGALAGAVVSMPMTFHFTDVSPDVEARMQAQFESRVPSIVAQAVGQVAEIHRTSSGYLR